MRNAAFGRSAIALLAFGANGHTEKAGTFRMHVRRLVKYLRAASGLNPVQTRLLQSIFEATDRRKSVGPNWLELALHSTPEPWKELASAFQSA